jgi:hypothetical protein
MTLRAADQSLQELVVPRARTPPQHIFNQRRRRLPAATGIGGESAAWSIVTRFTKPLPPDTLRRTGRIRMARCFIPLHVIPEEMF